MVTFKFLLKVISLPYAVVKCVIQYYTTGTIFSRTNAEFTNSLKKNLHLSVLYHLSGGLKKHDVNLFLDLPLIKFLNKNKNLPSTIGLKNYAKKHDEHSYWLVQNEAEVPEDNEVLIYCHGGGYLLNMFESQLLGTLAIYHALPEDRKKRTSVLLIDYSTTAKDFIFPTQLWESLHAYDKLVQQGYKTIHLFGDSAGVHLICSMVRFIAYPEEAKTDFKQFPKFDFGFDHLIQPKSLILLSPWVQPCTAPTFPLPLGQDPTGDLGALDTSMGDFYVGTNDRSLIEKWITFNNLSFDEHWAKVDPIANGNTLVIYGEREVLREGIEKFLTHINKHDNLPVYMEKGGIHASLVYVESLNYVGKTGAQKLVDGDFDGRFNINLIVNFLNNL